ncbi:hypothetical protein HJG60_010824 [Phyllostomus discolor]|uniref:Uncharacterized protein n=1 Tax=Phyllostomus discolor TaxID=89673 RepID=A0A834EA60_9CHIR|nr:hypothetical protein HJG60_010824 [Phyllostomus discolor]
MVVGQGLQCSCPSCNVWQRLVAAENRPELTAAAADSRGQGARVPRCALAHRTQTLIWASTANFQILWFPAGRKEILARSPFTLTFLPENSTGTKCFGESLWKEVQGRGNFPKGRTTNVALRELEI